MSRFKYLSLIEYDERDRAELRTRKEDATGTEMVVPTPDNDIDEFGSRSWTRVEVLDLTDYGLEPMTRDEFVEWWNDNVQGTELPCDDELVETVIEYDEQYDDFYIR